MPRRCFRMMRAAWAVLASLGLSAQAQPATVYLRAGRMWDSEKGAFVASRVIQVVGNRIAAVAASMPIPEGSRVLDLTKFTVLPGLIDAHTHLLLLEKPAPWNPVAPATQAVEPLLFEGDALRALHGAARARTFLEAGITAVQDLGNSGQYADVALKRAIADGSVPGPRMRVSGPGLSALGGQMPGLLSRHQALVDGEYRVVRSVEDGIQAVREHVLQKVDVIKVYSDSAPNRALLSVEEMAGILKEAHRYGLRVTAHCVTDLSVRNAALAGVDGVDHLYDASDETLKLLKEKGVTVIPTYSDRASSLEMDKRMGVSPEESAKAWEATLMNQRTLLAKCLELGIPVAAGSDMYIDIGIPQGQAAKRVLYAYAESGMPVKEILQAATTNAARHLGMAGRIGVLKPEAFADILAVEGDPERDIRCLDKVVFVMKDGKVHVGLGR